MAVSHEIQIEKLIEASDFPIWKFQITVVFKAKGIYDIVKGESKLDSCKNLEDKCVWEKRDALAQRFIITSVDRKVLLHIITCENSHDMFEKLCQIYDRDTDQQKCNLLQDFFTFKFKKDTDISSNLSRLQNIAFQLKSMKQNIDDNMVISKILSSLPEEFKFFTIAWESTTVNERSLINLTARLLAEENRNNQAVNNETVAFKSFVKKCYICKGNHLAKFCKYKNSSENKCKICKKTNHTEKDCFFRKNKNNFSNSNNSSDKNYNTNKTRDSKISFLSHQANKNNSLTDKWIVDSGCSTHMSNQIELFSNLKNSKSVICTAKTDGSMNAEGIGQIESKKCILNDVLFVPSVTKNLLSVNTITNKGGEVRFTENTVEIIKNNKTVLQGIKNETGLYEVNLNCNEIQNALLINKSKITENWHKKLGHLSVGYMKKLLKLSTGINISEKDINEINNCETCMKSKLTRTPFKEERTKAVRPLEIIHTDICGPIEPISWDNKNYFVTIIDDYTHFTVVYCIKHKSETSSVLKEFIAEAEAKWSLKVSKIRCDNGGEYKSIEFKNWCRIKGIILDYTTPYTPQLNGKAERLNRSIMEKARALLNDSCLNKNMWSEAILTAVYLLNRSPTSSLAVTPAEMWYNKKPDLSRLQVFGVQVYAKKLGQLKKLDDRSLSYHFVGYGLNAYRLWDSNNKKIIMSRDISVVITDDDNNKNKDTDKNTKIEVNNKGEVKINDSITQIYKNNDDNPEIDNNNNDEEEIIQEKRISTRSKRLPVRFNDYVLLTYQEAISGEDKQKWIEAIEDEKNSLIENNTWELVDKIEAQNFNTLTSKWVFKIKDDGRYRARLVVRGCQQTQGLDYEETFSPVISNTSLRLIFAIGANLNYKFKKFDIKTAFLYGDIKETIFMKLPEGFQDSNNKICKLKKTLYGLKQAPFEWNLKFAIF